MIYDLFKGTRTTTRRAFYSFKWNGDQMAVIIVSTTFPVIIP